MIRFRLFALLLPLTVTPWFVHSYDEVRVTRVVPFVDHKLDAGLLRLDSEGQFWVLNRAVKGIQAISPEGKALAVINAGKKEKALFKDPVDFAFGADGSLWVVDAGLERIAVLAAEANTKTGGPRWNWKKVSLVRSFPLANGQALAVSRDGIVAVAVADAPSVDVYSADGVFLHHLFPSEKKPFKKVSALAYARDGTLLALDSGNGVLHRFSADRKWIGATEGVESPVQVAVDDYGYAYLTQVMGRWTEIKPDGAIAGSFGARGKTPGAFTDPIGIALINGFELAVVDSGNHRLQVFQLTNREKTATLLPQPAAYVQVHRLPVVNEAVDVALVAPEEQLLLFRESRGAVERLDKEGRVVGTWKKKGSPITRPVNVGLDGAGRMWMADGGDHSLKAITENNVVLARIGKKGKSEGSLSNPDRFAVRPDNSVVVVDRDGSRVQVLGADGLFQFSVGSSGKKEGQYARATAVAANKTLIAVLDGDRKSLMFFRENGKFQGEIGNRPGHAPIWSQPVDIATDADGRFYILDMDSKRVRIFSADGQFLADFAAQGHRISCGAGRRVAVTDAKTVQVYHVDAVPRAPQDVAASDDTGRIRVAWSPQNEAAEYRVYRSSNGIDFSFVTKSQQTAAFDNNAVPGVMYTYAVTGVNAAGNEGNWAATKPIKAPKRQDVSLIAIDGANFKPVFTAAFKYYVDQPIGEVVIVNNDERIHRDVKISLTLKKYSDYASETIVKYIGPGEHQPVPVTMTFNDKVLELSENTPVQMEIRASYFDDNKEMSVSQNAPITLYSRNSISWTDRARIASFITPRDPPVVEFSRSAIRAFLKPLKGATVPKPLSKAALFYESMVALGVAYVPDPKTPYAEASINPDVLDYVQFPRETMRRRTGDCDDTTSLYAALLESVGVSVAMADMPGHILPLVNLEETDAVAVGIPEERLVRFKGTLWLPVESTLLNGDFMAACQAASSRVNAAMEKNKLTIIPFEEAGVRYAPVTLIEAATDMPAYPEEKVSATFTPLLAELEKNRYETQVRILKDKIKADPANHMLQIQLGLAHVEGGKTVEAEKVFNALLKEDEPSEVRASAENNLGNMAYLDGKTEEAGKHYAAARLLAPADGGVMVNQARVAWKSGQAAEAKKFLKEAAPALPAWREFASDIPSDLAPK